MKSAGIPTGFAKIKVARLVTTSVFALAFSSPALADCTPDPAPSFGTITCSGTDANGVTVSTNGVMISVDPAATVAGIVAGTSPTPIAISINNSGTIQSVVNESILGANTNLFGISGLNNNPGGTIGAIRASVGFLNNGGLIDGGALSAVRIVINSVPAFPAIVPQNLSNSGTIQSTSDNRPAFSYLNFNNSFYSINNDGLIANNGLATAIQAGSLLGRVNINNAASGTVRTAGNTAIVGIEQLEIYNEGLIQGTGDTIIFSSSTLSGGQFRLYNNGTINGSIRVVESGGAIARTEIRTGNGIINGSVFLGSGDDIVFTSPGRITGTVDGGGGNDTYQIDYLQNTTLNSGVATANNFELLNIGLGNEVTLTLANGFALNGTLNVANSESGGGIATVINNANLVSNGTAIANSSTSPYLTFINTASIATTHTDLNQFGVMIENAIRFENSGTLTATGGGAVSLSSSILLAADLALNTGMITADGVGIAASEVDLINSGTVISNQGVAVELRNSFSSNSGQISGASAGLVLTQSGMRNTGTISSAAVGVSLNGRGTLDNRVGGVITGGTAAVQGVAGTINNTVRNAGSINGDVLLGGRAGNSNNTYIAFAGGVLNGNLNLGSGGDRYVTALPTGGANPFAGVSGTVTGAGRETIVYMVDSNADWVLGTPPAFFSAESFDLANNATLNLTAAAVQSYNTLISGSGTVNLTADLTNNNFGPILTIGAATPRFAANNSGGVNVTSNGTLSTSRTISGSLAQPAVRVLGSSSPLIGISSFTNAGSINVNDLAPGSGILTGIAITGNGRATNNGVINLSGGSGVTGTATISGFDQITQQPIYNFGTFENNGSIAQVLGGASARGVIGVGTVRNSGSIVTGGNAITMGQNNSSIRFGGSVDNSGLIQSLNGVAIATENLPAGLSFDNLTITNRSSGTISGGLGMDAIRTIGSSLINNSGTINGNVAAGIGFGGTSIFLNNGGTVNGNVSIGTGFAANGVFMSNGGTVTGDLTFGAGNDMFISVNGTTGVNGTITAGAGLDTYAAAFTSNATVAVDGFAVPSDFELRAIGAIGESTIVTAIGPQAGLNSGYTFFGDGTIVNQAIINRGQFAGSNRVVLSGLPGSTTGLAFVNQGSIYDGISGAVRSFENSGRIGFPSFSGAFSSPIVDLLAQGGDAFRFNNSGMIAPFFTSDGRPFGSGEVRVSMEQGQPILQTASVINSGSIGGGATFNLIARDVTFLNSGRIFGSVSSNSFVVDGVRLAVGDLSSQSVNSSLLANRVSFENTGTLGSAVLQVQSRETIFNNSGNILGNPFFSDDVSINVAPTLTSFTFSADGSQSIAQYTDQDNLRFTNGGNINGAVRIEGGVRMTDIVNTGDINVAAPAPSQFFSSPELALNVGIDTVGSQTITVNNSGTISNSAILGSAIGVGGSAGFAGNSPAGATATINVSNSGRILANGGAVIRPFNPNLGDSPETILVNTALAVFGLSTGESNITITNALGGIIETNGVARTNIDPTSASAGLAAGDGSVAIIGSANRISFSNAGTVTGGAGFQIAQGSLIESDLELIDGQFELADLLEGRYLPGAVLFFNSVDTVNNTGTINGSVDLGAFDDRMSNYGAINGNVFLRSGNDAFLQGLSGSLAGTVDGGIGTDALTIDTTGGTAAAFDLNRFVNFESLLVNGSGSVGLSGALTYNTINLSGAGITVASGQTLSSIGPVTITGTAGNEGLDNAGAIAGAVLLGAGDDSVTNGGTIGGTLDLGEGSNTLINRASGMLSNTVLFGSGNDSLTNAGQIAVAIDLEAGSNSVNNSGIIGSTLTFGTGDDSLQNSGSISGLIDMGAGIGNVTNVGSMVGGIQFAGANDVLSNDGTISGILALGNGNDSLTNGGQINAVADLGAGNNIVSNLADGTLAAGILAGAGNDQLQNSGTINGPVQLGDGTNAIINAIGGIIGGPVTLGAGDDGVRNIGTINGSVIFGAGSNTLINEGMLAGTATFGAGDDNVRNIGTIRGSLSFGGGANIIVNEASALLDAGLSAGAGNDQLGNFGTINGAVNLGDGANMLVNNSSALISGPISFGAGNDILMNDGSLSGNILFGEGNNGLTNTGVVGGFVEFGTGTDTLSNGGTINGLVDLGNGAGLVNNIGTLAGGLVFGDANDLLSNAGVINTSLLLGLGDDEIANSGRISVLADLGAGNNRLTNAATGIINAGVAAGLGNDQLSNSGIVNGAINLGDGANIVVNLMGAVIAGPLTLGIGNDGVRNEGTFTGQLALGDGNNVLINNANGILADVLAGNGNDTVTNLGRTGSIALGNGSNQLNNAGTVTGALTGGSSDDTVVNSGALISVSLGAGNDVLSNSSTISGAVNLGDGDDTLLNTGRLNSPIDLGAGSDMFVLRSGSSVAAVSGGAGTDQVTLILNGIEASPDRLDFSTFTAFEALRHESGVSLVSNTANFGLIDIVAGRFIGAAGSTINSNTIMVGRGATFGSAGTVTGSVIVNGTLSPGASPGTMTVNGNVGFNQGSVALFELTPTTTDRLVVNGAVIIAPGSTLNLTGIRPITPGTPLDLITATGGISGSFGTIIRSDTIFGFTRLQGGSLQLLGLFAADPSFNPQVTAAVNYVNSVLQSPQAPTGLANALPSLVTSSGGTNIAAFSQLHPEVFASASQIGIENGLTLSKAIRASQFGTSNSEASLFTFAQGFGNWRRLAADEDRGTARANISSFGIIGGVGYGSNDASISVFAGSIDAKQDINTLGSTTKVDGIVTGVAGRFISNGFQASAMIAYDGSSASTARALFNGSAATSKYKLRGWTIDVDSSYKMSLSADWSAKAQIGLTHISSRRGNLSEAGGLPFDLDVLARKTQATFIDGELVFTGGQTPEATVSPWVSFGVRHQLSANAIQATGGFRGLQSTLTVVGSERSKTLPILGAGLDVTISKGAIFFADYHGEFGKGTEGQNVNAGVRIRF
jgi:hypothetical protein